MEAAAVLINLPSLHLEAPPIDLGVVAPLLSPFEATHLFPSPAPCPLAAAAAF